MLTQKLKIKNDFGENLDTLVEGNKSANELLIFVHGYGTDKDEGFASFIDLSNAFKKDYLNIRYDQSGYGESEGKESAYHLQKSAGDLNSIIRWVKEEYPNKKINIIAHSLGAFVTLLLSPQNINHIILTSIPNSNTEYIIKNLQNRIKVNKGKVNEDGITEYPRSRGAVQLIGKDFWRTLRNLKPVDLLQKLSKSTRVVIFKPLQDDVLGFEFFNEYKKIKRLKYVEVNGNHNFTDLIDRKNVIEKIKTFLKT